MRHGFLELPHPRFILSIKADQKHRIAQVVAFGHKDRLLSSLLMHHMKVPQQPSLSVDAHPKAQCR